MSTVRRDAVALGILIVCLASWSMPVTSSEVIESDDQYRLRHAGAECAKRGLPAEDSECYARGLHDFDCRQERNPNSRDTPEACVERRMAGGPKWLAPGEVKPWKPAPASTPAPSAPAPASDPAPQSSEGEADATDDEAVDQEDAGDAASEDGGEAVDGSGDEEAGGEETSDEETSGEETSGEETSGEETSGNHNK